jgi:cobalt/nickel transport system permease protein
MAAVPGLLSLPWAVHISDGVLRTPWLAGGFIVAGVLALLAAYRVRDEEIPRIAVLSAAFFVASLMHLRLGPTSVHLLLNGLVGVVLGRRAPLAILIGLGLQAALLGHGGFTTLGVNTCVLTLPALLAGWMFAGLYRLSQARRTSIALLWVFGCIIGMTSVLATLVLNAGVLLWGGAEDWHQIVYLVFVAHLPIVGLEGIVLGFTVSFLARVKPEMLGLSSVAFQKWHPPKQDDSTRDKPGITRPPEDVTASALTDTGISRPPLPTHPPALLLVALTLFTAAGPAHAHRPRADYKVLPDRQVRIDGWFDPGDVPMKGAKVQVFRPVQRLLAEGQMDEQGTFVFRFTEAETLEVVVSAGAGHRTSVSIPREDLERAGNTANGSDTSSPQPEPNGALPRVRHEEAWREQLKDALLGITFLLALAAFLLSWRNAKRLKSLQPTDDTTPSHTMNE